MLLTPAERQRRICQKLKEGKYEEYKNHHREIAQKSRDKKKDQLAKLSQQRREIVQREQREATRKRVAKCRALKKEKWNSVVDSTPPFSSAVALARATARAKRALSKALPKSPRRRKAVHQRLYQIEVGNSSTSPTNDSPRRSDALSDETVELVKEFYQRDDISRQAPGRKDVINVRDKNGQKVPCQTHHLTSSFMETYALFCKDYPNKIGKSKFAELRPNHVLLSSKLPHNVCLCKYHENFINAVNALHKVLPSVPLYTHELPQTCLCDPV